MRVILSCALVLVLSGCGAAAQVWISAGATYFASANNLGTETLKFIDDKDQRACVAPPK